MSSPVIYWILNVLLDEMEERGTASIHKEVYHQGKHYTVTVKESPENGPA